MIVYLNGTTVDENQANISIFDSGFLYGDGIFTTLRLYKGKAPGLHEHWQRLKQQAEILEISFPLSLAETENIIDDLVRRNGTQLSDARVRITVTRGGNPDNHLTGTAPPPCAPTVLIRVSPLPSSLDQASDEGIGVITLGPSFLRYPHPTLKSLNFLPSILALREAHRENCLEAIITSEEGQLKEGSISNVFLVKDGSLFTPEDDGSILAGLTRKRVMVLAAENNLACQETTLTLNDLENADEVFICNSIRQIVPVVSINGTPVGNQQRGPLTFTIQQLYDHAIVG